MLLTIIIHGRHDYYFGNFLWRIQTVLNKIGRNVAAAYAGLSDRGLQPAELHETEIVLVDWGSDPADKLLNALTLEDDVKKRLRCLYVDPLTVYSVSPGATYSSSHAANCAVRRARGRHILVCDSDVYWTDKTTTNLYDALRFGYFLRDHNAHELNAHFFWSARRHVPRDFNIKCPTIDEVDAHIAANEHTYTLDKPDPHQFAGATCALFATKEMWHEVRGLNESMWHWGANDIDIHHRLQMRYRYGGDVDDYGLKFYHLEHYIDRRVPGELGRPANAYVPPAHHIANGDNWGLRDQPVSDSLFMGAR